jgi:FKBP-type peptidyl-prolyl cis-trans isomerase SlyD
MARTITDGDVVAFHYALYDEQGALLDDSAARDTPLRGVVGTGFILPGLEKALAGKAAGERFEVTVPPALGYGERRGGPLPIPRSVLPPDVDLVPGANLATRTPDGTPMLLWIDRIEGDQVWVDPHHPLAGRTLHYRVQVLSVRPASFEERAAGRPLDDVNEA